MKIWNQLRSMLRPQQVESLSHASFPQEPAPASPPAELVTWPEPPVEWEREELLRRVREFPYWYHRIYLGNGVYTIDHPEFHEKVWQTLLPALPEDMRQASVLDIGANAGFFSIQAKLRNAGRVVAVETDDRYVRQAAFCCEVWNMDIDDKDMGADEIGQLEEQFDLVVFAGILYHLKHPLWVLEQIGKLCRDAVIIETEVIVLNHNNRVFLRLGSYGDVKVSESRSRFMKFLETTELNGDHTNWWVPDSECLLGMLRTVGFRTFSALRYHTEGRVVLIASKKEDSLFDLKAM